MRLPVIRQIADYIDENHIEKVENCIEVLENIAEINSIKEEELEVIGELLSNMYGAVDVAKDIQSGTPQKEALNGFMQRVMGSIDRS